MILDAEFQLQKDDPAEISMRMRKIWIMKKATQPFSFQTAGCIFKNPPAEVSDGRSAGQLIEQSGAKGLSCGDAEVSERHGNFIVNRGNACAADVFELMEAIRKHVLDATGVELENEVKIWRNEPDEGESQSS